MDYKLAKQLKDAGFYVKGMMSRMYPEGECIAPTLSELIEACGDKFSSLSRWDIDKEPYRWIAYGNSIYTDRDDGRAIRVEGDTPEEAVAKLWLKLHAN